MTSRNVILPLEGMPGSSVKDIARDMIAVAKRMDIMVSLNMNGVHLLALPSTTLAEIQRDYETQIRSAHD